MTKDEIIQMAREAGLPMPWISDSGVLNWTDLKAFADLIAAHKAEVITAEAYRCGHEAGAVEEREACAKLARKIGDATEPDDWALDKCQDIEAAIGARGTT